jgi:hypothetical protein
VGLETRWFFPSGKFNPAQSLQHREIDDEAMESTTLSLVGHEVEISSSQLLYILWVDATLVTFGHPFFCSRSPVNCCGFH